MTHALLQLALQLHVVLWHARAAELGQFEAVLAWDSSQHTLLTVASGQEAVAVLQVTNHHATLPLVLLPWDTALHSPPTDASAYTVVGDKGAVPYVGIVAQHAAQPRASDFLVIPPLSSVSVPMDIDRFWHVRTPGVYHISASSAVRHASRTLYANDADVPPAHALQPLHLATPPLQLRVYGSSPARRVSGLEWLSAGGPEKPLLRSVEAQVVGTCSEQQVDEIVNASRVWDDMALRASRSVVHLDTWPGVRDEFATWFDPLVGEESVANVRADLVSIAQAVHDSASVTFVCGPVPEQRHRLHLHFLFLRHVPVRPVLLPPVRPGTLQHAGGHHAARSIALE